MIIKYLFILLIQIFTLTLSQTINIEGTQLKIGMDKRFALERMHDFLDQTDQESIRDNFWLRDDDKIIGSMGFENEKLSYVTTDWDEDIDYLDSIELFNTLFSVLKNTFGSEYEGDIILQLKEIQEPNLEKLVINMYSNDGRSVRINRKNISLDIQQTAQKF
ncbi:MAG: hypothetical protein CMG41_04385 [Candidatus Marinimicrobia bacterium]|nr:hypothetical protein [Candidatus Neomarinimicrobiota bacterium]|tara:strand:- start:2333 stop:2818 length:486 start_codon:yes stop_codon:yes gene_type:complete